VENATSFSPADSPVTIQAQVLTSGGALIEIADQGVGMRAEPMAQANWRLDNPPVVDVEVSRRMGLFVVAQLAARHGIRVRLRPAGSRGLSALVWLPQDVITDDTGSHVPLRPASTASGNWATGRVTPEREASQDAGTGWAGIAPAPRRAPLREHLGMSDPGRYPAADDPARDAEPWAATGPLARMRGRVPSSGLGAGSGPQNADPGQGGGDQLTRTLSAATEAGQHLPPAGGSAGWGESTPPSEVVVPSGDVRAARDRLPIYEAVESDWFSGGRQVIGRFDQGDGEWYSAADDGYRAAEAVKAPTSSGTTRSGLPKRAPGANLVPGTAAASAASAPASGMSPRPKPKRSATDNRNRFASYQRGIQQGRAAAADRNPNSGVGTVS
jgi:hypothetical protein